jgi:hypothetical protein
VGTEDVTWHGSNAISLVNLFGKAMRWRPEPFTSGISAVRFHIGSHHETAAGIGEAKWVLKMLLGMEVMR